MGTSGYQNKFIYSSFLLLFFYELLYEIPLFNISVSKFFFLLYVSLLFLIALYSGKKWKQDIPSAGLAAFHILLLCNLISLARGILVANGYWDWKHILIDADGGISMLIPLAMVSSFHFQNNKSLLRFCLTIFKYSIFLIPIALSSSYEIYPRLVTPVIVFIILLPYLKWKERYLVLGVAILSIFIAIGWRTNVLNILLSFLILGVYFFRRWITNFALAVILLSAFSVPLYYLNEGIKGESIFTRIESDYTIESKGEIIELTADTRTALYEEVFSDLNRTRNLWLGKGPNGKYKTELDYSLLTEMGDDRSAVEVGFLRILIYNGILGFALYSIVLILAIYYGAFKTQNTLTKLLSLLLASHWSILFIEEPPEFSIYFYLFWVVVGLCFSKQFRSLTDQEIKDWIRFGK